MEKKEKSKRNAKMWGKSATEHQIWASLPGREILIIHKAPVDKMGKKK